MQRLVLYVTGGCHLCEEAQQVIYAALGGSVMEVDIAEDDALLERYGVRIPVLQRLDTGAEIGWPFGSSEVLDLISSEDRLILK